MSMLHTVLTEYALIAEEHHELSPIIMPPIFFALIAAIVLISLALVTHSYRDVSNRHSDRVPAGGDDHGAHH